MIGRWLQEKASPEARAALLTGRLCAFDVGTMRGWAKDNGYGCLLGIPYRDTGKWHSWDLRGEEIFNRFNALCMKLEDRPHKDYVREMRDRGPSRSYKKDELCLEGAAKAGVLIRNRILRIEAASVLKNSPRVSRETPLQAGVR